MSKNDEINYIDNVIQINGVERDAFHDYLFRKPYSDAKCWEYLSDVSQILKFLPAAPARVLDLGCGSGWTTEIFAASGYQALGLDIASDFVKLAQQRPTYGGRLSFQQHDYENAILETGYDAVVIFDALHHADSEEKVIRQAYSALKEGGVMIILEPGYGHSQTSDSLAAVKKYGTTEKE